jgi:hypothetical protein
MNDEPKPKRQHGCLFYGALVGIICLTAVLLALLLGLYEIRKMINQFTDSQAMALPTVQMSQPEMEEVQRRFDSFVSAVRDGKPTTSLTLTGDDINALIAVNPDAKALRGKVYVSVEGDRVKGQVSIPLSELGLPFFRGRYLNGSASFALSLQNGILRLSPDLIAVKGRPLPSIYMDKIRGQNLAQDANNDPRLSVALDHLESIQVKDSKVTLTPKQPAR